VCVIEWLQKIAVIPADCINRNGMERIDWGEWLLEQVVSVAGDTAYTENEQLLSIKRCLCPISFNWLLICS
jgi:hypothetical protein